MTYFLADERSVPRPFLLNIFAIEIMLLHNCCTRCCRGDNLTK